MSISSDIARNGLLLATQEGCINNDTADAFCNNMAKTFGSKNILISTKTKDKFSGDGEVVALARDNHPTGEWNPTASYAQDLTTCGLIGVYDSSGNTLINTYGDDYTKHVQRGETITAKATVEVNIWLNLKLRSKGEDDSNNGDIRFTFPVSSEITGISCKWFKGES
jgi:hypothetical protein